jgi:ankyrin repeat protein
MDDKKIYNKIQDRPIINIPNQVKIDKHLENLELLLRVFSGDLGLTRLHKAILQNDQESIIKLIRSKIRIDAQDSYGMTALHYTVIKADIEIIEILLKAGANTEISDKIIGFTPLNYAFYQENSKIATLLIQAGANEDNIIKIKKR